MTLQLTREPGYSRGYFSPRSVTGFLSDVYPAAADEVGKIYLVADSKVCICIRYSTSSLPVETNHIMLY